MNYYPHHIGDFNSATRHLTRLERSIYRDLIELYYDTETALIADVARLCRLVLARTEEERKAVEQVLQEFFDAGPDGWRHERCEAEIEKYRGQREAKSAAGKASAAKRAQRQAGSPCSTAVEQADSARPTNQNQNENHSQNKNQSSAARKRGFDATAVALPDWLNAEDWCAWIADRKARGKPVTEEGARRQLKQLDSYRMQGHAPADVIANSIACAYQGLFPPRAAARRALADWSAELRHELGAERPYEIDMGVIDASH